MKETISLDLLDFINSLVSFELLTYPNNSSNHNCYRAGWNIVQFLNYLTFDGLKLMA